METIVRLTGGIGVDRAIDAVGVDAQMPRKGPAAEKSRQEEETFQAELKEIAPEIRPQGKNWVPGDAPTQAFEWEVEALAKAGTLSIVGVYPETLRFFPIGRAMMKNLTMNMGNCSHRKYIPLLLEMVESGVFDPSEVLTQVEPMASVIDAYRAFDERKQGWMKVELVPEKVVAGVR